MPISLFMLFSHRSLSSNLGLDNFVAKLQDFWQVITRFYCAFVAESLLRRFPQSKKRFSLRMMLLNDVDGCGRVPNETVFLELEDLQRTVV